MAKPVNILIGVGGTGAKIVESALMLFAAGMGPSQVHVGLIDQDQANGNVERTRSTLANLRAFRKAWSEGRNVVDWSSPRKPPRIGSVQVEPLFPETEAILWCPEKETATLNTIVGANLDAGRRDLFDMLFMVGPEEQDLPMRKGYRGLAHVGATALTAAILERESTLIRRLETLMNDPNRERVNVFIVGSAFGGAGASGFPTLARALHRVRQNEAFKNKGNVTIGGLLMLPYFSFTDDNDDGHRAVRSDELLPKAKLALEYYGQLFQREQAFDRFYALGWDHLLPLGYNEPGSAEQCNPALPPEFIAATSILEFFGRSEPLDEAAEATQVMTLARQEQGTVRWRDLPNAREVEARMGQLLRFCVYWRHIAEPMIDEKRGFLSGKNWIQKLTNGERAIEAEAELNATRTLIDRILLWAATVEYKGGALWSEGPWNLDALVVEGGKPALPVKLADNVSEATVLDAFDRLIRVDSGEFHPRAGYAINDALSRSAVQVDNDSRGLGLALATVAKAVGLTDTE